MRSASGIAVSRVSVFTESWARAVAPADPGCSLACAASSAFAAGLFVGLPSGLETSESENRRMVSGLTTASTCPLAFSVSWNSFNCWAPSPVKSSSMVCPGFIEITVSIACPPNRSW